MTVNFFIRRRSLKRRVLTVEITNRDIGIYSVGDVSIYVGDEPSNVLNFQKVNILRNKDTLCPQPMASDSST